MINWRVINYYLVYGALFILCAGIFTSLSFSAGAHVLFFISGLYFLFVHFKNKTVETPLSIWALLALTIICWLSVIFNWGIIENPLRNILKTKYFLIGILSFYALRYSRIEFLNDKRIRFFVNLFLVSTAIASLSGLIGLFSGFNPLKMKDACHPERACGLYGMYMTYAYGLSFFMVIVTGLLLYRKEAERYFNLNIAIISFLINGLGLFYSFTRGAWLGFLLAVPFFFFKKNKKIFVGIIIAAVLGLGLTLTFSEKAKDTFFNRWGSNSQRIAFYETSIKAFQEKPVLGWGYKNFESNSRDLKIKYKIKWNYIAGHAHNNFLEHLASTGLLGALAFLAFVLIWLIENYKREDLIGTIKFPLVVSFLISGTVQYTFGDGENLFLLMLVFGIA